MSNTLLNHVRLRKAEIIPTVVDDFVPSMELTIAWAWEDTSKYNLTSKLGNTLDPEKLQHPPNAYINGSSGSTISLLDGGKKKKQPTFVLTMTDPDAPSRDDPKWSEMCHCIIAAHGKTVTQVVEYKPPGPPPKTGKHRYVFLAWIAANRTTNELDLQKPKDRKYWGYDPDVDGDAGRVGVRKWAKDNGLMPVAANFIYAQNEEQ